MIIKLNADIIIASSKHCDEFKNRHREVLISFTCDEYDSMHELFLNQVQAEGLLQTLTDALANNKI